MKRTVSTVVLVLISAFLCFGQEQQKYTSIKDAIQQMDYQTFCIKAHFAGTYDSAKLIFFIEENDYIIPVRLQKRDLGAEKRFLAMTLGSAQKSAMFKAYWARSTPASSRAVR